MRAFVGAIIVAWLGSGAAFAQPLSPASVLTPAQVQEAIDWGTGKIKVNGQTLATPGERQYLLVEYGEDGGAFLSTPFLRVALAAQLAKDMHREFGPSDAVSMLASDSTCHVVAASIYPSVRSSAPERVNPPQAILILPHNVLQLSRAVNPVWSRAIGLEAGEQTASEAAFPCSLVTPANDFVIFYKWPFRRTGAGGLSITRAIRKEELQNWR